ncbi:MAG: uroporphyrinogen decarboxylase family protein [Victivallales bacterium]|jgi:uroporphyrinogen-III decarboxylase
MTRKERLMASIRGESVDRPPVSFYEITGYDENPSDKDPFNIYADPSWKPVIELAKEKTDRIVRRSAAFKRDGDTGKTHTDIKRHMEGGSLYEVHTVKAGNRVLTMKTRRDPDVNTVWTIEHLLKDVEDLKAWLDLPDESTDFSNPDISGFIKAEKDLGDTGIVMVDSADPLCCVASLFSMEEYTVIALTEKSLFHKALEKTAKSIYAKTEAASKALPGRLWRICGPEYATPPYLPPELFNEYVVKYVKPMVDLIQSRGGYARVHCHGNVRQVLDHIVETGAVAIDPIEPPPQGDVELSYVRGKYGRHFTLFGNLEASDLENLSPGEFEKKIIKALDEGTAGAGRGFVLMPSACPYGHRLSPNVIKNYEKMVELAEKY